MKIDSNLKEAITNVALCTVVCYAIYLTKSAWCLWALLLMFL